MVQTVVPEGLCGAEHLPQLSHSVTEEGTAEMWGCLSQGTAYPSCLTHCSRQVWPLQTTSCCLCWVWPERGRQDPGPLRNLDSEGNWEQPRGQAGE